VKRIRDQFGDGLDVTEYPSKKAALDLLDKGNAGGDKQALAWVSDPCRFGIRHMLMTLTGSKHSLG
jgi:hypothetical protein